MIYYRVNIARPCPNVMLIESAKQNQNERLCDYIEPLREAGKVKVSGAYSLNLNQYKRGEPCGYGPGRKYHFWFTERALAEQFINDWYDELGQGRYWSEDLKKRYQDYITEVVEEEIDGV